VDRARDLVPHHEFDNDPSATGTELIVPTDHTDATAPQEPRPTASVEPPLPLPRAHVEDAQPNSQPDADARGEEMWIDLGGEG
jgi:hypothetical protein